MTIFPPDDTFRQRVVWIALPAGVELHDDVLHRRISVFIAPQLLTADDATLADFPDWVDWPDVGIEFDVYLDDEQVEYLPASAPSENFWPRLLPRSTRVAGFEHDVVSDVPFASYGMSSIEEMVKVSYGQLMAHPEMPPGVVAEFFPDLAPLGRGPDAYGDLLQSLHSKSVEGGVVVPSSLTAAENIVAAKEFHKPKGSAKDSPVLPRRPEKPDPDFHQIVTLFGDHPELLRRLGLVRHLRVEVGREALPDTTLLRVQPRWEPSLPTDDICPATLTDGASFRPAPRIPGSDHRPGFLAVGDESRYSIAQLDTDGGVEKLLSFATDGMQTRGEAARLRPREVVPPAQRSAGLQLIRHDRAEQLKVELSGAETIAGLLESGDSSVVLGAEDLTRGVRPDVRINGGTWRSLVQRHADYEVEGEHAFEVDDEATVTATLAGDPGDPERGVRVGETVVQWTGWSLAAERPGTPVSLEEFPGDRGYPETDRSPLEGVPLSVTTTAAPGTLPALRYGLSYEMRLRTVDLAGNSLPVTWPTRGGEVVTRPVDYTRIEPIESPADVAVAPRTPGEQGDTWVVRTSDFEGDHENTGRTVRYLYPPKGGALLAEHHGEFDDPDRRPDRSWYHDIVTRESDTFTDVFDPSTAKLVPAPGVHREDEATKGALWLDDAPDPTPYLPDPMARGVAFWGFESGDHGGVAPFLGAWPDLSPVVLHVRRGEHAFVTDFPQGSDEVHIVLPYGAVQWIRLSTAPLDDLVDLMAPLQWGYQYADHDMEEMRGRVLAGDARLVTPYRSVRLVHAVRQPLVRPDFEGIAAVRPLGATAVHVHGRIQVHNPTTRHIDMLASWTDPVDDGPGTPPPAERSFVDVPAATLTGGPGINLATFGADYELGDTRHHAVRYRAIATSPFGDYFTRTATRVLGEGIVLEQLGHGVIPESVRVRSADGSTSYGLGKDFALTPPDGGSGTRVMLERVPGGAIPADAPVRITWLPGPITRAGRPSDTVHVPSSAPPAAPSVRYLMPTFRWDSSSSGSTATSRRRGNGLRVYLDRPWWSSGEGELLGVVLPQLTLAPPLGSVSDSLAPYVTQVGFDPTVVAPSPPSLGTNSFPLRAAGGTRADLPLQELEADVTVVGHEVEYDEERDQYFCDIEIATGASYLPFVRLALVRYQPHSVDGAHLSPVVLADFMQLAPDRTATVQRTSATRVAIDLVGPSYSQRGDASVVGHGTARVVLERHQYPTAGDAGWQPVRTQDLHPVADGASVRWSGSIEVSPGNVADHRLVIEQSERILTDDLVLDGPTPIGERLVHQDVIRTIPPPPRASRPGGGSRPIPVTTFVQNLFESLSQILRR